MIPKILIGEDEPHLEEILKYVAGKIGLEFYTANNGEDVLSQARKYQPDIMLLDIYMPKVNGIEVCKQLKDDPLTNHIYIVVITASAKVEDEEDAWKAGADEFMKKPFSPKTLLERLNSIICEEKQKRLDTFLKKQAN